ncbi:MAG: hypothetical protein AAGJ38_00475 [Planctomycetota bacterium]
MLSLVAVSDRASAQNAFWVDPNGGAFSDPGNWVPGAVPDDTDTVFFQVPGTYEVNLPSDARIDAVNINDGAGPVFRAQSTDPTGLTQLTIDRTLDVLDSRLTFETIGSRQLEVEVKNFLDISGFASDDTRNTLSILDGVTFKANNTTLGSFPGRLGRIVVSGTNARWDSPARIVDLGNENNVGTGGGGELLIEAGGEFVTNRLRQGSQLPNANNSNRTSVHVTGVGEDGQPSTLEVGLFRVASRGLGRLRIDGGAQVVSESTLVGTDFGEGVGTVEVLGTDAAGNPSLLQADTLIVNDLQGPAGFRIADGARVESGRVQIRETSSPIVVEGTGLGGTPSTWVIDELFELGREGTTTVEVRDGARVETQNVQIGTEPQSSGQVRLSNANPGVGPATTWFSHGQVQVGFSSGNVGFGEVEILSGTEFGAAGRLAIAELSTVHLDGGTLFLGEYDPDDPNGGGVLRLTSGKLEIERILGDFTLENVTLSPADDLGVAGILGNYEQHDTGTLLFELGGNTAGVDFDQLTVTGFADLGGALAVELTNGFTPDANDTFTIFDAAILAGIFDNVLPGRRLTTVDGRGSFVVDYGLGSPAPTGQIVLSDFLAIASLSGDFNGSGSVEQGDLNLVLNNWGVLRGSWSNATGFATGTVDQEELNAVLNNWGSSTAPSFAGFDIPEPTSLALLAGLGLHGLRRRSAAMAVSAVGVVLVGTSIHAQDTHRWIQPNGGTYATTSFWNPNGVPAPLDTAVFDLNADYEVRFLLDRRVAQLQILGGDVAFSGSGISPDDPTYTVGGLSFNAGDLTLQRGPSGKGFTLESTGSTSICGELFVQEGTRFVTDSAILDRTGSGVGGLVFVNGTSPEGELSGWTAEQVFVGNVGRGEVRVEGGGFVDVETNAVLGSGVGSVGELTVEGTGFFTRSLFESDGNLVLGQSGTGRLTVRSGGLVRSAVTLLGTTGGGQGFVRVSGTSADWNTDQLFVERGDVLIEADGSMDTGLATIGRDGPSSVTIDGERARWDARNTTLLGFVGDATVAVLNGGTVVADRVFAASSAGGAGRINLGSSDPKQKSRWIQSDRLDLGGDGSGPSGAGVFNVLANAEATIDAQLTIRPQGQLVLRSGGHLAVQRIDHGFGGQLDLAGGALFVHEFIGDFENTGATLSPFLGDPDDADRDAGMTTVIGDFRQHANATLEIDIVDHSLGCGIGYDHVSVQNTAQIGGTLDVWLRDEFVPNPNETYDILNAGTLTGQFANAAPGSRLTTADGQGSFLISYGPTSAFDPTIVFLSDFRAIAGLAGDFNNSGLVEQGDLNLVLNNWGSPRGNWSNANGFATPLVDQEELNAVLNNWGNNAAPSFEGFNIPEPASAFMLGFFALMRRRS